MCMCNAMVRTLKDDTNTGTVGKADYCCSSLPRTEAYAVIISLAAIARKSLRRDFARILLVIDEREEKER